MTAREAVKRARVRMLAIVDTDDAMMMAALVDHIGQLERAISLVRSGHETFVRHLPDETAVHEVGGPTSVRLAPAPKRKR